ncbi:MAG: LptA/OstA family protein [Thermodesulfobacteriota bacterium]
MKGAAVCLVFAFVTGIIVVPEEACTQEKRLFSFGDRASERMQVQAESSKTQRTPAGEETVFSGNVSVRQGDFGLECDELSMVIGDEADESQVAWEAVIFSAGLQGAGGLHTITATGNVRIVENKTTAHAQKFFFDNQKGVIALTGGRPRIAQGTDEAVADAIVIHMDENRVELLNDASRRKQPSIADSLW